jgi:hypothetical protein
MQLNTHAPYELKDLYQNIDLIDRKIAHSQTWETFASQEAQDSHVRKLTTKRATLIKSALVLTNLGVQCDPQFLPRSFEQSAKPETATKANEAAC